MTEYELVVIEKLGRLIDAVEDVGITLRTVVKLMVERAEEEEGGVEELESMGSRISRRLKE